jgi:hypothetical protein
VSLGGYFREVPKFGVNLECSFLGEMCPHISTFLGVRRFNVQDFLRVLWEKPLKIEVSKSWSVGVPKLQGEPVQNFIVQEICSVTLKILLKLEVPKLRGEPIQKFSIRDICCVMLGISSKPKAPE